MSEQQRVFKIDDENEMALTSSHGVFEPTGTTTVLIEAVQNHIKKPGKLLDLGCGSGVVGLALHKKGLIQSPLYASDLSEEAVASTKENAALNNCSVVAKSGALFLPWQNETFDYIVDDVSGVAEEIARVSPWFQHVPCASGIDGTVLVLDALREAVTHLNSGGRLFFPIVSLSNVDKIVKEANEHYGHVECLIHREWPMPKEMYEHQPLLKRLQEQGHIHLIEKFGMMIFFTDVYVAYN